MGKDKGGHLDSLSSLKSKHSYYTQASVLVFPPTYSCSWKFQEACIAHYISTEFPLLTMQYMSKCGGQTERKPCYLQKRFTYCMYNLYVRSRCRRSSPSGHMLTSLHGLLRTAWSSGSQEMRSSSVMLSVLVESSLCNKGRLYLHTHPIPLTSLACACHFATSFFFNF